ncbi:MAG: hypothetical protein LBJ00_18350 [Planctomycetaceae bacterium]|nr:hypothetical protein [Planctomycetaceae bacterium]
MREIYVPVDELKSIFESAKNNLLINRKEFETLRKQAREVLLEIDRNKTQLRSPVEAVLLASDYKIEIADLRAVIEGEIEIEVLTDDVVMIPFQIDRVSIIEAIDIETKKPAALEIRSFPHQTGNAVTQAGRWILQGKKRHKMKIIATTPLDIDSTRQRIAFRLPYGVKNSLQLAISGDVELKSGAAVISRKVEKQTDDKNTKTQTTKFELLPQPANNLIDITMSLNSHRIGSYQAVIARSAQFAEITEQYERLHATVSLTEMHQGISEAVFEIPAGFEMTDVKTKLVDNKSLVLDKWVVEKGEKNNDGTTTPEKLKLKFRERLPGSVTIFLSGIKVSKLATQADLKSPKLNAESHDKVTNWRFPLFNPVNVAANSMVLGLLVEQEIEMTDLECDKLYPVDPLTLHRSIPASAMETLPGSPLIRFAAAWYAPHDQVTVKANFKLPKTDCSVDSREVLILTDKTPVLQIDYAITANTGKFFETIIEMPTSWKISSIIANQKILDFREVNNNQTNTNTRQILVKFPKGIIPGETFRFALSATGQVEGWFAADNEKKIKYPKFNIVGAKNVQGKIGIQNGCEEDWDVIPVADGNLIPLDESVKQNLFPAINKLTKQPLPQPVAVQNSQQLKTVLAYEYLTKPFDLELKLEKLESRLNVKAVSIYSFAPTLLQVNYELWFTAKHASTKHVAFLLPIETPNTISIAKISNQHSPIVLSGNTPIIHSMPNDSGSKIKETFSSEVEIGGKKYRRWEILLSKPQADLLKLNVNFEMQIDPKENNTAPQPFKLPAITAENTAWQSDIIAIQGDEELDLNVLTGADNTNTANTATVGGKVNVLRSVDVGTIAEMYCQPGERLIGVYSVLQDGGDSVVMLQRNQLLPLVTAAIENVTITALLGDSAASGTLYSVIYNICTEGASMKLTLGKNDEIWSVKLDGQTMQPQQIGNDILIPIQQQLKTNRQENSQTNQISNDRLRRLEIIYRNHNNPLKNIRLSFPSLREKRSGGDVVVPVMQTRWGIIPPSGYEVEKIGDTVIEPIDQFDPAMLKIFRVGLGFAGSVASNAALKSKNLMFLSQEDRIGETNYPTAEPQAKSPLEGVGPYNGYNGVIHTDKKDSSSKEDSNEKEISADKMNVKSERYSGESRYLEESNPKSGELNPQFTFGRQIHDTITTDATQMNKRIIRLKSVQPVTVVIDHDLYPETDYSLIGTKNIQEIPVKLLYAANRDLWGWAVYCTVLLVGLLFIKLERVWKARFVFGVLIVGTILVFVPHLDALTTIFNAAVYASLTTAIIFIITAIFVTIKRKRTAKTT